MEMKKMNIIDENAEIEDGVQIGHFNLIEKNVYIAKGVSIGNHNIILAGTHIGKNTTIEHNVLLKNNTIIGDNCFVDSYVRSSGDNEIRHNVTLRFGCTIARKVLVESDVFISPNVMTIYSKHTGEASEQTIIKRAAFLGTAAVIGPNVTIEEEVVLGAQAYASKNCDIQRAIYIGVPAEFLKMKTE